MNKISNIASFTVTQLNNSIKNLIENNFQMISVTGEVCQVKKHSSGHIYFSLKDEDSIISVICWRSITSSLNLDIENGIKVVIKGKVTTYSKQSKYQIILLKIQFEGEGSLLKVLEQRKKKLADLGFFDPKHKKQLPKYPNSIGVITSESGAVIKDIIHRISDRFPLELIIFPANVQGEKCLNDLINGLQYFNKKKGNSSVDIIMIARGGGSLEDLMPFNEELLIEKIFNSVIPVISAVGHETDFPLCDFVADLRAPTPSAGAEMIVPDRKEMMKRIDYFSKTLKNIFLHNFDKKSLNFKLCLSKIPDLTEIINNNFQNLDYIEEKLEVLLKTNLKNMKLSLFTFLERFSPTKFENLVQKFSSSLSSQIEKMNVIINHTFVSKKEKIISMNRELLILSYKQTLKRGFAVIRSNKKIVSSDSEVKKNQKIEIEFFKDKTFVRKI